MSFFFFWQVGYQDASGDSVVGMPESIVLTHRFFSFVADPLAGDCVHRS